MKGRVLFFVLISGLLSGSVLAQSSADLGVYAAMSKLEANAAEAVGGLTMYVLNGATGEYAEDYADDVATFYGYLRTIEALDPSQADNVNQIRDVWGPIEDEGEEIIAEIQGGASAATLTERINTWYASLETLDDELDTALSTLLEANDLTVEPTPRDDAGDSGDDGSGDTDTD